MLGRESARPDGRDGLSHRIGQLDLDFQHFQVVLAFQVHLEVVAVDLDVLGDHRHQLALQRGQVVGLGRIAPIALVRQDDLQPLLGNAGGFFLLAEQEGQERSHGYLLPNRRLKKPGFSASMKRSGLSAIHAQGSDVSEAYKDVIDRFLGEDKPLRFIDAEKPGFFKRLFGSK